MEDKESDELLIRIDERLKNVEKLLSIMQANCTTRVKNINEDIESLKMWKNRMLGALTVIGAIISSVVYIIVDLFDRISVMIGGK